MDMICGTSGVNESAMLQSIKIQPFSQKGFLRNAAFFVTTKTASGLIRVTINTNDRQYPQVQFTLFEVYNYDDDPAAPPQHPHV